MWIIIWLILFNNNFNLYFCAEKTNWMKVIVDRISAEMTLKQISVFTFNRLSHDKDDELILSEITKKFPTILINQEKVSSLNNNKKFISKSYENAKHFSWIVIVLKNDCNKPNIQKVKNVFDFVSRKSRATRPKLLVISADRANWNIDELKFHVWDLRYSENFMYILDHDPFL